MNFGSDFMQHFFILEYKTLPTLESYHYGIVITETSFSAYFIFFFFFFFGTVRVQVSGKKIFSPSLHTRQMTPLSPVILIIH